MKEYEAMVEARVIFNVRRVKAKSLTEAKVKAQDKLGQFLCDLQAERDYAPDSLAFIEAFGNGEVVEIEEVGEEQNENRI